MATRPSESNADKPAVAAAAAAVVTVLFGLLTLLGVVALAATHAIGFQQAVDPFVYVSTAVQGLLFVGLGYGIFCRSRSCMWVALGLTALIVVHGILTAMSAPTGSSMFLLVVSPVVVILNYFALRATPKPEVT